VNLAQLNIAVMLEPLESERMADFVARLAEVNAVAEAADGFVWRLKDEDGPGATSYRLLGNDMLIVNLSVWRDLDALRAFVIGQSGHRAVLSRRREWFEPPAEAMTVCWPVPDGHEPTLAEAEAMLLRLRTEGPSVDLFPFTYRGA
jgi:hypothetical protein